VAEIVLLFSADINIQRACERFEAQGGSRVDRFLEELDRLFGLLATFPELGPVVYSTRRRLLMREFNYGIFYTIIGTRVIVSNVLDLRSDPEWLREQFGE
jgi:plasmid stabilization system protein ParE